MKHGNSFPRDVEKSPSLRDIQTSAEHSPEKPALADPTLRRGLDDVFSRDATNGITL